MKTATEAARYDYPGLNEKSLVIDAGAYRGGWAFEMWSKYGCGVLAFEPIQEFFTKASDNLKGTPVTLVHAAVGGTMRTELMGVQNDSTGVFAGSEKKEQVQVLPLCPFLLDNGFKEVAVLKLNVEGMEYEVLEHILDSGNVLRFQNFQVQFHHNAPRWEERYGKIAARLALTHHLTWRTPFVWENWAFGRTHP